MLKALVTDVDGTITDRRRRINTAAVETIRTLVDAGIEVVLASGNTVCFMDGLCKMVGTDGTIIGENGGVYRRGFAGILQVPGDRKTCLEAFEILREYFAGKGTELELFGAHYRFADVAFARTVDPDEARAVIRDRHLPVRVLDTGFAIHLQVLGVNKGTALAELAGDMGILPDEMMAIGDSENDIEMLEAAGIGVAVRNATAPTRAAADWVSPGAYGDGFVEAVKKYYPYFFSR
ncbi:MULTISPECIES: phosphoglycolate phosphatase [unclassified Methanoculleus]|uniref:phosphoglycolate phosphatase n=1 Tax=unclassified Methanoculleus TaxID=2619537 RepID=UPI0025E43D7D|nr:MULTISPECIES: phosphoglycolate phosphatase [unclassified Methanoculleus]MCK9317894.1 phosphoglycolate phosphatase [Methanoculleus sp.]MDD2253684.1 phosphoglycolate phosphatase [Methanoculleus sp.]MDD2788198.1 phosphoglycolate phosphatase [Methanoculleus sp.]MDD3217043.1 phosphoglycolate phosphatase [Methanoculleus sp.]MDD4314515.1 phosphoglycolate phosphatase [Methanoculleus sp.]